MELFCIVVIENERSASARRVSISLFEMVRECRSIIKSVLLKWRPPVEWNCSPEDRGDKCTLFGPEKTGVARYPTEPIRSTLFFSARCSISSYGAGRGLFTFAA